MKGKVAIDIKDANAVFTLIDKLADREIELLEKMILSMCENWISVASENILNKLSGFNNQERNALKVVTEKEILRNRFKQIFLKLYNSRTN